MLSLKLLGVGRTIFKQQTATHKSSITWGLSLSFSVQSTLQLSSSITCLFHFCLPLLPESCASPVTGLKNPYCSFWLLVEKCHGNSLNAWCHCMRIRTRRLFLGFRHFALVDTLEFFWFVGGLALFSFKFYFPCRVSLWRVAAHAGTENIEWFSALRGVCKNQRLSGCLVDWGFLQVLDILSIQTTLFHVTVGSCYEYFI